MCPKIIARSVFLNWKELIGQLMKATLELDGVHVLICWVAAELVVRSGNCYLKKVC